MFWYLKKTRCFVLSVFKALQHPHIMNCRCPHFRTWAKEVKFQFQKRPMRCKVSCKTMSLEMQQQIFRSRLGRWVGKLLRTYMKTRNQRELLNKKKQTKRINCHELEWIEWNDVISVISELIISEIVTRFSTLWPLRTCKVFGTPSTRINVTFGILPFLSLGECG